LELRYDLSKARIGWTNLVRSFDYPYYGGGGTRAGSRGQRLIHYLRVRYEWMAPVEGLYLWISGLRTLPVRAAFDDAWASPQRPNSQEHSRRHYFLKTFFLVALVWPALFLKNLRRRFALLRRTRPK
jgi:hypothetical protein